MPLIGRRRELVAIERLLQRAQAGEGGVLVVAGPPGSGRTALARAARAAATARGLPVTGVPAEGPETGSRLTILDAPTSPPASPGQFTANAGAVLVTTTDPDGADLRLAPLTLAELGRLLPGLPHDVVHAIWLAGGGLPGPSLDLADQAVSPGDDGAGSDPVAVLALRAPSRSEFLVPDAGLLRLLETAAARPLPDDVRARVLVRWARELLGDPSAHRRRRELADEAVRLARGTGTPQVLAEVLDGRLHALWDPAAARERFGTATEIIELARRAGRLDLELNGLFWRFTAQVELGDLDAAEATLVLYARTGEPAGDPRAAVVVRSRQAVLAMIRGRLDLADELGHEVARTGRAAGLADTARLTATLDGQLALLRGRAGEHLAPLRAMALRLPGHYFEATAARVLALAGRDEEALLELERLLPTVLAGTGPRWLGAVADLALVASRGGDPTAVRRLYDALSPYRGRLVVWGGANTVTGPVDDLLGRLAQRLGLTAPALAHLDDAVAQEERLGALPWLAATLAVRGRPGDAERARSLAARLGIRLAPAAGVPAPPTVPTVPTDEWRLWRDGDDWHLEAGTERARLRHLRGLGYLRMLVSSPGQEIPALDLVAGEAGLRVPESDPVLDAQARGAFRDRLRTLEDALDRADRAGDPARAATVTAERDALVAELRRATGTGGRSRRHTSEAERARVNVTRALATVLGRLETAAPLAAAHLRASLRTGGRCRYQPAPGGPGRWRVTP
ncbi:AAA family ATPase [Kineosporia sp. J2-2]|uniref:AAA family ATPase n=1 Tax=Kineosporia corallincola TaxID=2835133 RepID=A0ABS5TAT1_9ACTN|nr:AAA family ATPase [Kineosporia corallincola]MBT0768180.1 AAA family ATPase [Kineosporia corallincola]